MDKKKIILVLTVVAMFIGISTVGVGEQLTKTDQQPEKKFSTNSDGYLHKTFFSGYFNAIWNKEDIEEIEYFPHWPLNHPMRHFYYHIKVIGNCTLIYLQNPKHWESSIYTLRDTRVELTISFLRGSIFEDNSSRSL